MPTLHIEHLAKSYKKRQVIRDVSMTVSSGEIVGLLGPNGAGKTTCFYMIVGIVAADQGVIRIDDMDITQLSIDGRARKGVGYLPQEASIFRKLTVSENIMAILETRKELNRESRTEQLNSLIEEFQLNHIRHSAGMALSGGERRRVEIARALATDPAFILLDEPFAGVDPISVHDIQDIIRQLQKRDIGILITDHNVRETLGICEKAYIVGEGKIVAEGSAEEVLNAPIVKDIYLGHNFSL